MFLFIAQYIWVHGESGMSNSYYASSFHEHSNLHLCKVSNSWNWCLNWFSYFKHKFYGITFLQIFQYATHSKVLSIKDTQRFNTVIEQQSVPENYICFECC